jgi:hypothetical protein
VVVVTAGALCFMPDLKGYFLAASRLLEPKGVLTIYEAHPLTRMFLKDRDRKGAPLAFVKSYFDNEPLLHTTGLDYQGGYHVRRYFQHKLADVLMGVVAAGFSLEHFAEHDKDPSQSRVSLESLPATPPLSYILTGRKTEIAAVR